MSREGLKRFVHAVEHSAALRKVVNQAIAPQELVAIAISNGFVVSEQDLKDDAVCSEVGAWFDRSWIQPSS